jgi:hypothetical protein
MMRRPQVLGEEAEYRRLHGAARRERMTLAEWVRQALRAAFRQELADREKKLGAVRAAARHSLSSGDVEQMAQEIARGYRGGPAA